MASLGSCASTMTTRGILEDRKITHDLAISKAYHAIAVRCNFIFVRHDDDRLSFGMQLAEDRENLHGGCAVEISRGFIREKNRRTIQNRARNRNALSLTTRKLIRSMVDTVTPSNTITCSKRARSTIKPTARRVHKR